MSVLALALLLAAQPSAQTALIRVGEVSYLRADVAASAETVRARTGAKPSAKLLIDAVVNEACLAIAARTSGATASEEYKTTLEAERRELLARVYWETEILAKAIPSEKHVLTLFHSQHDKLRLDLIVLATREDAKAALDRLKAGGEMAFEASRSLHSSGAAKGDTGTRSRGELPAPLADAAIAAGKGSFFGPIEFPPGWAIGRLTEFQAADEKGLAAVRPGLEAMARRSLAGFQKQHFINRAKTQRAVSVDERWLTSLGTREVATKAESDRPFATVSGHPLPYRLLAPEVEKVARSFRSHGFGPTLRIQTANSFVDTWLLAKAAEEAGLDARPDTRDALRRAEVLLQVRAESARIARSLGAGASSEKVLDAVSERAKAVRKGTAVSVDEAAVKAVLDSLP